MRQDELTNLSARRGTITAVVALVRECGRRARIAGTDTTNEGRKAEPAGGVIAAGERAERQRLAECDKVNEERERKRNPDVGGEP